MYRVLTNHSFDFKWVGRKKKKKKNAKSRETWENETAGELAGYGYVNGISPSPCPPPFGEKLQKLKTRGQFENWGVNEVERQC